MFAGKPPSSKSQSIETAVKRRLITCRGSVEELYSGQKLKLEVKNRSRDTVVFHVDPGQIFTPTNAAYQPLIATRQKTIRLAPGEERPVYVNALCGDQPKMSASDGTTNLRWAEGQAPPWPPCCSKYRNWAGNKTSTCKTWFGPLPTTCRLPAWR